MAKYRAKELGAQILEKAKEFGASLAGIAHVEDLKESPSHLIYGKLDPYAGVGARETHKSKPGVIAWPENARSAIVIGVEHPENRPELDWWKPGYRGGTAGNRILMSINAQLSAWLREDKGIKTIGLSYFIESGGIFLKDAAAMAGLGCIGENNMLVTPEFGPRVRLRAMLTDQVLTPMGPIDFDPCLDCSMPCRKACPQKAFDRKLDSREAFGLNKLPARTGVYSRNLCNFQMELDVSDCEEIKSEGRFQVEKLVRYCRRCELACPIGSRKGVRREHGRQAYHQDS